MTQIPWSVLFLKASMITYMHISCYLIGIPSATLHATKILLKYFWIKSGKYRNECCCRLSIIYGGPQVQNTKEIVENTIEFEIHN